MKRARPGRRRKEKRGRNKGLEESWKKDGQLDGRRAEVTGRRHQLSPLGEGPSKGVASQSKPRSSWFPGLEAAEGIQVRGDPEQGQAPSPLHFRSSPPTKLLGEVGILFR